MKNSFVLYTSYQTQMELLSMEQRGLLLTAIMAYSSGDELPEMDGMTAMAFSFIKADLDRAAEKYEKTCEARREAGRKGGNQKANAKQTVAKQANAIFAKQKVANVADNDDEDEDDDDDEDEVVKSSVNTEDSTRSRVIEAWRALEPLGITPIRAIMVKTKRDQMLASRIRQYGLDDVLNTINIVKECSFLHGATWFSFDWFIKPNNYQKVRDGAYRDRAGGDRMSWVDSWAGGEVYDQR